VFDSVADSYDLKFTRTTIGSLMRDAVWRRLAVRFAPGSRVLEMNCGTGEDALWMAQRGVSVLATDISPLMLRVAESKLSGRAGEAAVRFQQLAWEQLDTLEDGPFDGMLSNFGGLNCVHDLRAAARSLAGKLQKGAIAMLCIMGPTAAWEWGWFLLRGKPAAAFRRLQRRGVNWSGIQVHYPSIAATRRAFAPEFRMVRVCAVGALLPPPYTEQWTDRHPRLLGALNRMERRCEAVWPLPQLADHYLIEFKRE
jgi:SAM-dependent methyltransferase